MSGYWVIHVRRAGKAHEDDPGMAFVLGPVARAVDAVRHTEERFRREQGLVPSVAVRSQIVVRDESEVFAARFMAEIALRQVDTEVTR